MPEECEGVRDNGQVMKHPRMVLIRGVCVALTLLSGLLQEVEQDGGCLLHTQLLCVLTARL